MQIYLSTNASFLKNTVDFCITVKLPPNEIPPILPGTSVAGCPYTNGTFILPKGKERVDIEALPGLTLSLAAGEHEVHVEEGNCTIKITVEDGKMTKIAYYSVTSAFM